MRSVTALAVMMFTLAACGGGGGAGSAGPLTVPEDTTTTTLTAPDSSTTTPSGETTPTSPDDSSPTTRPEPPSGGTETTVLVYFLDTDGRAVPRPRTVTDTGVAAAAVRALITGPDASEAGSGLATAFPPDTVLLGITIDQGTAVVDLSAEFETGAGSASTLGRLAQLVYTLTEFSSVERVRLVLDGKAVDTFGSEGVVIDGPLTRSDFTDSVPIGEGTPSTGGAPVWTQNDLPAPGGTHPEPAVVVLVPADDHLNVRVAPGAGEEIMGRLLPGVTVAAGGPTRSVNGSTWVEIATPSGAGWVNGFYLTSVPERSPGDAAAVAAALAERMAAGGDLTDLISSRGLWVAHHAPPVRFPRSEVGGLLTDATARRWGSNALEPDSPEIQPRTFSEAIAERYVDAYDDADTVILVDEVLEGPNGRPAALALPTELRGFRFVTVHDPGDEARYEGLDWMTWIVSLSYEDGRLKVVGLTVDEWAP